MIYKIKNAQVASPTTIIAETSIAMMSWPRAAIKILLATEVA
jgi:hypothetical protein